MKQLMGLVAVGILSAGLAFSAQNGNPPQNPPAQTNAPHAYCDKDGDGLCDYTGLPVGQCRQANCAGCPGRGAGQGRGQGRGPGAASCPRAAAARAAAAARK